VIARVKGFAKWFFVSGCIGVLMAVVLYLMGTFAFSRAFAVRIATVLCPQMVLGLGLGDPPTTGALLLLLTWVLGTNFVLYGLIGLLLRGVSSWFRYGSGAT
jgi:hypothetical protein